MRKKHSTTVKLLCTVLTFLLVFTGCTVSPENIEQTQSTSTTTPQTAPSTTQFSIAAVTETQAENDWSVELLSTTCDGENARIVFSVTAPTDINLEEANKDYSFDNVIDCIIPGNTMGMTMEGQNMFGTSMGIYSMEHNVLWSCGAGWEEDNDGLTNTLNWFVKYRLDKLEPNKPQTLDNPFGTTTFYVHFENFKHAWYDEEVQKNIGEKYAGQEYMIDGEEMAGMYKTEVLVEKEWNFEITFSD